MVCHFPFVCLITEQPAVLIKIAKHHKFYLQIHAHILGEILPETGTL